MTKSETIAFLKQNYNKLGLNKCAQLIPEWSKVSLGRWARQIGEKVDRSIYQKKSIDLMKFHPVNEPEIVYLMGLIFADGYLDNKKHKYLGFQISSNDFENIKHLPVFIGKHSCKTRQRKTWKKSTVITYFDKNFVSFMKEKGIKENSFEKITQFIPSHLIPIFLRGYFDGDGCWSARFSVSAPHDFDWTWLKSYLTSLDIRCGIYKTVSKKNHQYSCLTIYKKADIIKLGDLIYHTYPLDRIGFSRKFDQFVQYLIDEVNISQKKLYSNIGFQYSWKFALKQKQMRFTKAGFKSREEALYAKENYIRENHPNKVESCCFTDRFKNYSNILNYYRISSDFKAYTPRCDTHTDAPLLAN